jgi:hypothetical protein
MSAAQWLIAAISATLAVAAFVLMRYPHHRREQFRGEAFSLGTALAAAALLAAVGVVFVWAQGRFESP